LGFNGGVGALVTTGGVDVWGVGGLITTGGAEVWGVEGLVVTGGVEVWGTTGVLVLVLEVFFLDVGSKSGRAHEGGLENDLPSASQHQMTLVLWKPSLSVSASKKGEQRAMAKLAEVFFKIFLSRKPP
uniref:hypothetical protein n=1 Tax=Helicobacter sp. L8 TaxID=2316078 RepID=UPI0019691C7C